MYNATPLLKTPSKLMSCLRFCIPVHTALKFICYRLQNIFDR